MMCTDPIADLLTRIRNAQLAGIDVIQVPASRVKIAIVQVLKQEGFIRAFKCVRDKKQGVIKMALKYEGEGAQKKGVIHEITRRSKPGCRRYVGAQDIPVVKRGYGVSILSTSRGIMTGKEAKKLNVGGEYLCSIY